MQGDRGTCADVRVCFLQTADFGPRTALKVVDSIRDDIRSGKVKTRNDVRYMTTQAMCEKLHLSIAALATRGTTCVC